MMKASVEGNFDVDKSSGAASLFFNASNVKLRTTMTDATIIAGPSLNGLSLVVEEPDFFIIDYNVPKKKLLNLTYIHSRDNRTIVDGSLVTDPTNKLSANYMVSTKNCKLVYTYAHGGIATFEQCYDLGKNPWDFL
ncbi:hypothetical protein EUTSA_v10012286mg, partial [Eutrema salsugineum]